MRRVSIVRLAAVASAILAFDGYCGQGFAQTTPNVTTLTGGNLGQGFNGSVVPVVALSFGTAGSTTVQNVTFNDWTTDPNASLGNNGYYNSGVAFAGSTPNDVALQAMLNNGLYGLDGPVGGTY